MKVSNIIRDDDAVSPVIGVILMVAITVILAAVIGTFVLGLGDQVQSTAPQASFNFDYTNTSATSPGDSLTVTHDGGDSIPADQLNASISGAAANDGGWSSVTFTGAATDGNLFDGSTDVTAGSSDTIDNDDFYDGSDTVTDGETLDLSASTVRVVWTNSNGDNSATLGEWDGPEA